MVNKLRLGVDVGGTNTDAVLLDISQGVIASAKHPTTPDITRGIQQAVKDVLDQVPNSTDIQSVSIGTTHFVNALVERDPARLDRVAVIRLCGPFSHGTPPCVGFPLDLRALLQGPYFLVSGGLQIDGSEISSVDPCEIESACKEIANSNVRAVVVSSVFAPIDSTIKQEEHVASIARTALSHVDVVCSKDVAHLGLLERENAAILNASLLRYAKMTVAGFQRATRSLKLKCPIFITSNDGMLLSCAQASQFPVRTFSSGPTNSMRGAAFLAALGSDVAKQSALVVDIGGTTTDIGMLLPTGFPRQAAAHHELCGVVLNLPMPHVTSIGLGGGSLVRQSPCTGNILVGPDSVGHRITSEALVFNGSTLTATDIAVAAGRASIGDPSLVENISPSTIDGAQKTIKAMLQNTLDIMKTSAADIPIYLVGGGSILAPDELEGVSRVHRLPHYDVANAVGAAVAQISGVVDSFEDTSSMSVSEVRKIVEARAIERAISAGADPQRVTIIESEAIPIAYASGRCRFYVKAAGEWDGISAQVDPDACDSEDDSVISPSPPGTGFPDVPCHPLPIPTELDISSYVPNVQDNQWFLSETDLEWISDGCYVLGCGGGGSPLHTFLELREMVRNGSTIRVVDLAFLSPDAMVGYGGGMGSPEVSSERLLGKEYDEACAELWNFVGITKPEALCALEIGGGNGMVNLIVAASKNYDIPVVDGDFMGRAYPTLHQITPNVFDESGKGLNFLPSVISSGDGNIMIMTRAKRDTDADAALRAACVEMGTDVGLASKPLKAKDLQMSMISNTVSLSWRIGRAIALARKQSNIRQVGRIIVDAVGGSRSAKVLFSGKIADVRRRLYKGHTIGEVVITALAYENDDSSEAIEKFTGSLVVPFKNENLYAEHTSADGQTTIQAVVPDLICILDAQNGSALGTQEYKYGLRVVVIGITAAPQWTGTARGMAIGGPAAFGFHEVPYVPLGVYTRPKSVIEEYRFHD
ncbi:hydantoinase [Pisolithus thermaeus]|nr:hydantoinase [Pisolithus thermaeus]